MRTQPPLVDHSRYLGRISQQQEQDCNAHSESGPSSGRALDMLVAATRPGQHGLITTARPPSRSLPGGAGSTYCRLAQNILVRRVIADDPFPPERRHSVEVEADAPPSLRRSGISRRGGIETLPAIAGKECLHPGMCVLGANYVISREVVKFIATESVYHARGNPQCPQHYRHRGSEVLAMALLSLKQEIRQRIFHRGARQLKRVAKVRFQVVFNR